MKRWLEWISVIIGNVILIAIFCGIVYVGSALFTKIIDGIFGNGVADKVSIFIGIGLYTYLITKPIREAILHLENVTNRLDKRIEKLENSEE